MPRSCGGLPQGLWQRREVAEFEEAVSQAARDRLEQDAMRHGQATAVLEQALAAAEGDRCRALVAQKAVVQEREATRRELEAMTQQQQLTEAASSSRWATLEAQLLEDRQARQSTRQWLTGAMTHVASALALDQRQQQLRQRQKQVELKQLQQQVGALRQHQVVASAAAASSLGIPLSYDV